MRQYETLHQVRPLPQTRIVRLGAFLLLVGGLFFHYGMQLGGWGIALFWPGLSFSVVATGYVGLGPRVFGKRRDGTIAPYALLLLLPYFIYAWVVWRLVRLLSREDCYNRISPEFYLGRRPLPRELPREVAAVVDLTAEFPEPEGVRTGREYICAPTLDASVPSDFEELVERVLDLPSPTYVHCAQGHGRSGTLVAALLMAIGTAREVDEAISIVRKARPGVRLNALQKAFLQQWRANRSP